MFDVEWAKVVGSGPSEWMFRRDSFRWKSCHDWDLWRRLNFSASDALVDDLTDLTTAIYDEVLLPELAEESFDRGVCEHFVVVFDDEPC